MNLTERERIILQLTQHGLSDYKIARRINTDPPSVTRSRKTAYRKIKEALVDLSWVEKAGINLPKIKSPTAVYNFFL